MKKYWFIFRKHKVRLLILSLSIILSSVFQIVITYIGGTYIDTISTAVTTKSIYLICLILMVLSFSNQIVRYILSYIMNPLIEKIVFEFEYYMLEHLKKISIIEYKKFNVAYLTKRIEEDSRQIAQFFVNNYTYIFVRGIEVLTIVIIVLRINFILGIIMILFSNVFALCLPMYFSSKIIDYVFNLKKQWISPTISVCIQLIIMLTLSEYFVSVQNFIINFVGVYFIILGNVLPIIISLLSLKEKNYEIKKG